MSDLREALSAAVEEHTPEPVETVAAVESTPAVESAPSEPVESSAVESSTAESAPVAPSDKPKSIEEVAGQETTDSAPKPTGDPRIDRAPQSWKGDAKKLWAELPLSARQEVLRREREITTKLNESAQARQNFEAVRESLAPHMDRINQAYGGNPITAINTLMSVDRTLRVGTPAEKAQLVANTIKKFGVDIIALDSLLAGEELPQQTQQLSSIEQLIEQRLAPVQSFLQRQQEQEQRNIYRVEQEANNTVEAMSQDDRFPYFNEVREDMADLIEMSAKKGFTLSLQEAYNKAVRMNDGTFQASSARENTQSATQAALAAHQEAQKAKGAAVSVSGNPTGTGTNIGNPADLRGTIAAALGSSGGRL